MGSYVQVRVAGEAYAVAIERVLEVAELGQMRAVPRARPEVLGIKSLSGRILPVVDLARLLGVHRTAPPGRLLVAEACGFRVGFAIDEVTGIGELPEPEDRTESAENARSGLLTGASLSDGELVGVVDVPRVFDTLDGTRR